MEFPKRLAPPIEDLRKFYVGKNINQLPKPSLILDQAKMKRHCDSLWTAVEMLEVDFRAHIKTHKTIEGTRLQAGETSKEVRLVVSTIAELEHVLPVLREFKSCGRQVNVLYGIPLPRSQVDRLAAASRQLGEGTISVMIDHISQLDGVIRFLEQTGFPAGVYLKVDTGYHRAGLPPSGINKDDLVVKLMELEGRGHINFIGLYSHSSLSYNDSTPEQAMTNLENEIEGCIDALRSNESLFPDNINFTISVGASPQVTSVQNLVGSGAHLSKEAEHLRQTIRKVTTEPVGRIRTSLELHAGVYSVLDIQQLSTRSRVLLGGYEQEIAVSVIAEVCSVYNHGERQQPEALAAVGVLGLGREPCAAYEGWGVVDIEVHASGKLPPKRRLIVKRVSQEHCILSWAEESNNERTGDLPPIPLEVGQSVRIYPNHACITGACYGWYCVVDSSAGGQEVVDVWVRAS